MEKLNDFVSLLKNFWSWEEWNVPQRLIAIAALIFLLFVVWVVVGGIITVLTLAWVTFGAFWASLGALGVGISFIVEKIGMALGSMTTWAILIMLIGAYYYLKPPSSSD